MIIGYKWDNENPKIQLGPIGQRIIVAAGKGAAGKIDKVKEL